MIKRRSFQIVTNALARQPAVVLLGPRQVGKTTLALEIAAQRPSVYLDLEAPADRAKLADPELYLADHEDELVILDEVQRVPDLFQTLRGIIDAGRRRGKRTDRFLLLGSASIDLLQQSSESLAGRIAHIELGPIDPLEVSEDSLNQLWVRGGFPESFLATDEADSLAWREDFIRTYLERDVPQLGPRIPAQTLRRFWTMLAHNQVGLLNAARLASGLGVSGQTVTRYTDLMVDLLLVRRLPAYHRNVGKRLVKAPKVHVRDSGIAHALLGLGDRESVLGHPVAGGSWEGFVIESLLAAVSARTEAWFYRTAAGAEIDLLLTLPDGRLWAIEIKRSVAPKVDRGFHHACADLEPERRLVVYAGTEVYPLGNGVEAIPLIELARQLMAMH